MPLRKLTEGSSFAPETLDVIYQAFDLAWEEIGARFGNDPTAIEFGRARLARAVLSVAKDDASDPARLKADALNAFALMYPPEGNQLEQT